MLLRHEMCSDLAVASLAVVSRSLQLLQGGRPATNITMLRPRRSDYEDMLEPDIPESCGAVVIKTIEDASVPSPLTF
jgi:hypothetical protein